MRSGVITFEEFSNADRLGLQISEYYDEWDNYRSDWLDLVQETQEYVFATDTRSTSVSSLGWKNSTHLPKLCQIRDNLYANYKAAMFPNEKNIEWEPAEQTEDLSHKASVITAYMRDKMRSSSFEEEFDKCVWDYILYGNTFGITDYENNQVMLVDKQRVVQNYVGPVFKRISPLDIVFNPTATDFKSTAKIIRELTTLGDLKRMLENTPSRSYVEGVFDDMLNLRKKFAASSRGDVKKNSAYIADGFSSWKHYFETDYVELLHYYGDVYDRDSGEFLENQHIVVVDRNRVILQETHPSWFGVPPIFHVGWRPRPDNLYAMGPLDNLVGLQYRIDHLENSKADALDLIVHPVFKIRGLVEDFNYGPNAKIFVGDDGDVEFMAPDASVLQYNAEIAQYMQIMEEMAGAPRQSMGFRTPGEKTKFEVQILENGANKVFLNKTAQFERVFLEPVLNSMLEHARRELNVEENIRVQDETYNFQDFMLVTKEDITASGKLRPVGARRFAVKANMLQDLVTFSNTPLAQDQSVSVHFSGYKIAKLVEDLMGLEEHSIVEKDVKVFEGAETTRSMRAAEQLIAEQENSMNAATAAQPTGQQPQNDQEAPNQALMDPTGR